MKKYIIDLLEKIFVPETTMNLGLIWLIYAIITLDYISIFWATIYSALSILLYKRFYIDGYFDEEEA